MLVLTALAFLGLLQTLFAAAGFRGRWIPTCLYCLLPGVLAYALHPWVLQSNFKRINDFLMSNSVAATVASLLILEAVIKAFCLIDRSGEGPHGVHWLQRVPGAFPKKAERILPYVPAFMLLFLLFYGQAWLFHTIEGYSFKTLSLLTALALASFFILGISLLRRCSSRSSFDRISYDLLFLQFVIAIALPLLAQDALKAPPLYDNSIYINAIIICTSMLVVSLIGYCIHHFLKNRTQLQ